MKGVVPIGKGIYEMRDAFRGRAEAAERENGEGATREKQRAKPAWERRRKGEYNEEKRKVVVKQR